jgi:hypothetical protein
MISPQCGHWSWISTSMSLGGEPHYTYARRSSTSQKRLADASTTVSERALMNPWASGSFSA